MQLTKQTVHSSEEAWLREYAYIWLSIKREFSDILRMISLILDKVTQFIMQMLSAALIGRCFIHDDLYSDTTEFSPNRALLSHVTVFQARCTGIAYFL